jgi:putative membrane protein
VVTRARAFNPQVFLELVCYVSFSALLFYLTWSGKYLTYVTPRMEPYLYFTAIVMLLWAAASSFRLFRPRNRVRVAHCFVPAIPILLLLLPHSPLSSSDLSYGFSGGSGYAGGNALAGLSSSVAAPPASSANDDATARPPDGANRSDGVSAVLPEDASRDPDEAIPASQTEDAAEEVLANDPPASGSSETPIEVGDDEFYSWLSELYMNLELYEGRRIVMTGFVFKDPEALGADEFVPARLGMTCCVADLIPYGIVCKYDKAGELEPDAWVRVAGVVQRGEYEGMEEPQIVVTSIEPADPVEGYLYPFGY